jgi:[ribosomal protein S18]-alanine N-acetyltransferase
MIQLRRLEPRDVPRIAELERELFGLSAWSPAMIAEELDAWGRWYVVAVASNPNDGESVVGYAGLWFDGEVTQVMTIGVDPAQQHRGIGRGLLDALINESRRLTAKEMFLEVAVDNDPALNLYRSVGFTPLTIRKRYYQPENKDAYTMRLMLQ